MKIEFALPVPYTRREYYDQNIDAKSREEYEQYKYGGSIPFLKYDFNDGLAREDYNYFDADEVSRVHEIRRQRFKAIEIQAAKEALSEYDKAIKSDDAERVKEILLALVVLVDEDHWVMLRIAEKVLGITTNDVSDCFDYEELRGVFEGIVDGVEYIPWLEKCSDFYTKHYVEVGTYVEQAVCEFDVTKTKEFRAYREELMSEYSKAILELAAKKAAEVPPLP